MIVIVLIISFLLDGIVLSLTPVDSYVLPLFSLLSLVVLYPYYSHNKRKMYASAITMGILYDIVYTNTLFLNTLLFLFLIYLVNRVYKVLTNNFINTFLIATITIILYRVINYLFFIVLGLISWNIGDIVECISHSLIINYVYIALFYFGLYAISKKLQIKRNV